VLQKDHKMQFSNVLVTGGSGFIGSNFIPFFLSNSPNSIKIINFDSLTYAGNPLNLTKIEHIYNDRYHFVKGDIRDFETVKSVFKTYDIDAVIHFAAESHVDRSIEGPSDFVTTNINGTFTLLEVARSSWDNFDNKRFHHVSTDEVFGSLGKEGYFSEITAYDPRSPYSASKASSDHLVRSYFHTYGLPITISNCSNNYGPYQFPEKLIPLMILNILESKPLPVYGDGKNIRDWLFVEDHAAAIMRILEDGIIGETYCIGGENEWENIALVKALCNLVAEKTNKNPSETNELITFVKDRPGHDKRYAIDCSKMKAELDWKPKFSFNAGLALTIDWYLANTEWLDSIKSGSYLQWIDTNYHDRS
jgi:dTDP-glucose 4,6-dehydratase